MAEREIEGLPEVLHEPLLEAIHKIREHGVEVTLVGGLAVRLLGARLAPTSDKLDDPSVLAAIGRGTQDIDLAVARGQEAEAERALRSIGYDRSPRDNERLVRDGVAVDILPLGGRRSNGGAFSLTIDCLAGEPAQLRGVTFRVATCAELIVLKAVAWFDRYEGQDLADIGTLALIDQIAGGVARQALADRLDGRLHRELQWDLRRVADTFRRPEDQGPVAFVKEVVRSRANAAQLASVDEWEQVVAGIVSDAVKTVLSGLGDL